VFGKCVPLRDTNKGGTAQIDEIPWLQESEIGWPILGERSQQRCSIRAGQTVIDLKQVLQRHV
jgi:hypothetical protein